ncbi:MAG: hypothetical protein MHPSP_002511, partial [Paramarteilia canceri]
NISKENLMRERENFIEKINQNMIFSLDEVRGFLTKFVTGESLISGNIFFSVLINNKTDSDIELNQDESERFNGIIDEHINSFQDPCPSSLFSIMSNFSEISSPFDITMIQCFNELILECKTENMENIMTSNQTSGELTSFLNLCNAVVSSKIPNHRCRNKNFSGMCPYQPLKPKLGYLEEDILDLIKKKKSYLINCLIVLIVEIIVILVVSILALYISSQKDLSWKKKDAESNIEYELKNPEFAVDMD